MNLIFIDRDAWEKLTVTRNKKDRTYCSVDGKLAFLVLRDGLRLGDILNKRVDFSCGNDYGVGGHVSVKNKGKVHSKITIWRRIADEVELDFVPPSLSDILCNSENDA